MTSKPFKIKLYNRSGRSTPDLALRNAVRLAQALKTLETGRRQLIITVNSPMQATP